MNRTKDLKEIAKLFLKLGCTAFGGSAAHIIMMRREVVEKRKWISEEHFLDLIGATNLIPGPNSTQMAIHIGNERGGWKGLILAGLCFIFPAVLVTLIFAWLYKEYGQLPEVQPFIYGITPAVVAVVFAAVYPLAKKSVKSVELGIIGLTVFTLSLFGFNEIYLIFGAGFCGIFLTFIKKGNRLNSLFPFMMILFWDGTMPSLNLRLFLIFLKIGSILYGSGYVLFALLDAELVATGLLSRQILVDAIAVGQITPGPFFSSVTFIGYQMNGWIGTVASTVGIFLPAFIFMALLSPVVKYMRHSILFSAFSDAVNIAAVAVIFTVCYEMGRDSIHNLHLLLILGISLFIAFYFKNINTVWIIVGGSLMGYALLTIG